MTEMQRSRGRSSLSKIELAFNYSPAHIGFREGLRPYLEYRNLGLTDASGGILRAEHMRVKGGVGEIPGGWHVHKLDLQFILILKGSVRIRNDSGFDGVLGPLTAGFQPCWYRHHEYAFSEDFEILEITSPAVFETIPLVGASTQMLHEESKPRQAHYDFDRQEAWKDCPLPRSGFSRRNLGLSSLTDGGFDAHLERATVPRGLKCPRNSHSVNEWMYVLDGSMLINADGLGSFAMGVGDAITIPAGMGYETSEFSENYLALVVHVPAHPFAEATS